MSEDAHDYERKIKVYISAGWFSPSQEKALSYLESYLFNDPKYDVYSPRKEMKLNGVESVEVQNKVFKENCDAINRSDLVISSTVDKDCGTLFEDGYAYANGKAIVYTLFDERIKDAKFNLMLAASGIAAFTDKAEFESFMNGLTQENLKDHKKRWTGDFE